MPSEPAPDVLDVALLVSAALEDLGIRYYVGGSVASSLLGEPRATSDIDIVVELSEAQVAPPPLGIGALLAKARGEALR